MVASWPSIGLPGLERSRWFYKFLGRAHMVAGVGDMSAGGGVAWAPYSLRRFASHVLLPSNPINRCSRSLEVGSGKRC